MFCGFWVRLEGSKVPWLRSMMIHDHSMISHSYDWISCFFFQPLEIAGVTPGVAALTGRTGAERRFPLPGRPVAGSAGRKLPHPNDVAMLHNQVARDVAKGQGRGQTVKSSNPLGSQMPAPSQRWWETAAIQTCKHESCPMVERWIWNCFSFPFAVDLLRSVRLCMNNSSYPVVCATW